MEYFESVRSYKYMYFEKKMNSIMRSPKIIKSMGLQNQEETPKKQSTVNNQSQNVVTLNHEDKVKIMQVKHKY